MKEVLQQAIDFAEYCLEELDLSYMASNQAKRLIEKSRQAIAEAEKQEPYVDVVSHWHYWMAEADKFRLQLENLRQALAEAEDIKALKEKTEDHDVDCLCADCEAFDNLEDHSTKSELNAMYCRGRDDGFEAGRLQGIKQERALWELARIGQEIEAEAEKQEPKRRPLDYEPLTFAQLCEIETKATMPDGEISLVRFARAIEAAHGIIKNYPEKDKT